MNGDPQEQRRIARLALEAVADGAAFALAGSGAIREHGLIDRPTQDVDLFTVPQAEQSFGASLDRIIQALEAAGYQVETQVRHAAFARLSATSAHGQRTEVDLGVDWRAHPPVHLEVGPVLSVEDAVGNKLGALYSRGESRDYLDVDAIRSAHRFSDAGLVDLLRGADAGFEPRKLAESLERAAWIQPEEVRVYGVSPEQLDAVKARMKAWAAAIRDGLGD